MKQMIATLILSLAITAAAEQPKESDVDHHCNSRAVQQVEVKPQEQAQVAPRFAPPETLRMVKIAKKSDGERVVSKR